MNSRQQQKANSSNTKHYLIIGIAALLLIYLGGTLYFSMANRFLPNTYFSNTKLSLKKANQATNTINQQLNQQTINLNENDQAKGQIKLADAKVNQVADNYTQNQINKQNKLAWPLYLFGKHNLTQPLVFNDASQNNLTAYTSQLTKKLNVKRQAGVAPTMKIDQQGSVTLSGGKPGNKIDANLLNLNVREAIVKGQNDVNLQKSYLNYNDKSQVKAISNQVKQINKLKATYEISGEKVQIPNSEMVSWLTVTHNEDGQPTVGVDQSKAQAYLRTLNDKYATNGAKVTFNSTQRGQQTVPGGNFGWSLATKTDANRLSQNILKQKDFDIKATQKGSGTDLKKGELGKTYVEVDKQAQHMWIYKDGKQVLSTPVVTGKPANDNSTPTGVFFVWNKQQDTYLKGKNDNGSKYSSHVDYWMPVDYTGVGIHDAPWQPTFGGDWYLEHGSHGCVNTPPAVMGQVYSLVAMDTPVIIY